MSETGETEPLRSGSLSGARHGTATSSSYHGSDRPIGSGGGRAGRAAGTSVGRPRWLSMRRITGGCSMRVISSRRSPQRGHARTSNPKLRCSNSDQSQFVRGRRLGVRRPRFARAHRYWCTRGRGRPRPATAAPAASRLRRRPDGQSDRYSADRIRLPVGYARCRLEHPSTRARQRCANR